MTTTGASRPVEARRLPPSSGIRRVFDRAKALEREGREILHLEIGRPDWRMPPGAQAGAEAALEAGTVHYIANRGLPELRAALADDILETTGATFDPETELVVTLGASEAVAMAMLALTGSGDEVLIPEPAWNHYRAATQIAGATPVSLPLRPESGFALDPDALAERVTARTRLVVVNSPGNPTGAVQDRAALEAVASLAERHGFYVLADEVYRDFVYDGEGASMASVLAGSDRLLYVNSFSKSYAMTGWRIGYVAAAAPVSDALNRIHQYLTVCGVPFAQAGAARLLRDPGRADYLGELRAAFRERRDIWTAAFRQCDAVQVDAPGGAFYLFPRIEYRGMSGEPLCLHMLEEHGLAMVPGDVFGPGYEAHVRISYGGEPAAQRAAAERLTAILNG